VQNFTKNLHALLKYQQVTGSHFSRSPRNLPVGLFFVTGYEYYLRDPADGEETVNTT